MRELTSDTQSLLWVNDYSYISEEVRSPAAVVAGDSLYFYFAGHNDYGGDLDNLNLVIATPGPLILE